MNFFQLPSIRSLSAIFTHLPVEQLFSQSSSLYVHHMSFQNWRRNSWNIRSCNATLCRQRWGKGNHKDLENKCEKRSRLGVTGLLHADDAKDCNRQWAVVKLKNMYACKKHTFAKSDTWMLPISEPENAHENNRCTLSFQGCYFCSCKCIKTQLNNKKNFTKDKIWISGCWTNTKLQQRILQKTTGYMQNLWQTNRLQAKKRWESFFKPEFVQNFVMLSKVTKFMRETVIGVSGSTLSRLTNLGAQLEDVSPGNWTTRSPWAKQAQCTESANFTQTEFSKDPIKQKEMIYHPNQTISLQTSGRKRVTHVEDDVTSLLRRSSVDFRWLFQWVQYLLSFTLSSFYPRLWKENNPCLWMCMCTRSFNLHRKIVICIITVDSSFERGFFPCKTYRTFSSSHKRRQRTRDSWNAWLGGASAV